MNNFRIKLLLLFAIVFCAVNMNAQTFSESCDDNVTIENAPGSDCGDNVSNVKICPDSGPISINNSCDDKIYIDNCPDDPILVQDVGGPATDYEIVPRPICIENAAGQAVPAVWQLYYEDNVLVNQDVMVMGTTAPVSYTSVSVVCCDF